MKDGLRQCMAWLHTWVGLLMGWLLFFVFVTGTAGYFSHEIDRWMRPELPLVRQQAGATVAEYLDIAMGYLAQAAPAAHEWGIDLPGTRERANLGVWWRDPAKPGERLGKFHRQALGDDGALLKPHAVRATGGGRQLYRMHYALRYVPFDWAIRLVGVATMLMLLALVSGVITHKKIFTDFFTFRPGKGQRSWMDAHVFVSVIALPFFVMITYSGLVFFMYAYMPAGIAGAYGPGEAGRQRYFEALFAGSEAQASGQRAVLHDLLPLVERAQAYWGAEGVGAVSVRFPNDAHAEVAVHARHAARGLLGSSIRFDGVSGLVLPGSRPLPAARSIHQGLLSLHAGGFADPWLRWLYFGSGLLGCAMVATGLVLWTAKRRQKQDRRLQAGRSAEFGYRLVDALNIGTIAGLCTAVAAYFWANRLLPTDFARRAEWEFHCLFIAWGVLLLHAALRLRRARPLRVWQEQLGLAAAAFALLPLLNAATTDRHLGVTLPAGDWVLAGFDLVALAIGAFFAVAAWKVRRRAGQSASGPGGTPTVRALPS